MTEPEITHALHAIAALAPDPDRLRTRLAGRIRVSRQRRALLVAGAAAAATAAVGVPAALWWSLNRPADGNLADPVAEPTGGGNARVPMRLRPTWLPEGIVEVFRDARVRGPHQLRIWTTAAGYAAAHAGHLTAGAAEPSVVLSILPEAVAAPPSTGPIVSPDGPTPNTVVLGLPAVVSGVDGGLVEVSWRPGDGSVVSIEVKGVQSTVDAALRVARSLVPDRATGCETALRFGWLPAEVDPASAEIRVSGLGDGWSQSLDLDSRSLGGPGARAVLVNRRDQLVLAPGPFEPATLRGRGGEVRNGGGYAEALLQLPGDRWLYVVCYAGTTSQDMRENVIRLIDSITIGPDPYLGWIGRR
jgi:hypothetical protein